MDLDANILQRAKLLYKAEKDQTLRRALIIQSTEDINFWIENFVWIFEPRSAGKFIPNSGMIPMSMTDEYAYQQRILKVIVECIQQGKDLFIEKSREMGLSWLLMVAVTWGWLFHGWSALVGSRKEELVDRLGDMDSLLPKVRFIIKRTPWWMLPRNFNMDKHANWKNIINPKTEGTISGESNNENFGSGGRRTVAILDEFAKWTHTDRAAWTSLAQTTPCRIAVSTPYFKNNKFHELSKDEHIVKLRVHYSENPKKNTPEWIAEQKKRLKEQEFAQELDIDYSGTTQAGVYTKELQELQARQGIRPDVHYYPQLPVYVGMDFGMGAYTAMVCAQVVGYNEEIRVIDYYQNHNAKIEHYISWLKDPDRVWNKDGNGRYTEGWANIVVVPDPNQATNRELGTGLSLKDMLLDAGLMVETVPVGRKEAIAHVKEAFPRVFILSPEVNPAITDFLDSISGLHYEFDEAKNEYTPFPVHDKSSHGTDAFKFLVAYIRVASEEPQSVMPETIVNPKTITAVGY